MDFELIRTEAEHKAAKGVLEGLGARVKAQEGFLQDKGMDEEAMAEVLEPMRSLVDKGQAVVDEYERACRGELGAVPLSDLGRLVVGMRIANNMSLKEAADAAGMDAAYLGGHERGGFESMALGKVAKLVEDLGYTVFVARVREGFEVAVTQRPEDGERDGG